MRSLQTLSATYQTGIDVDVRTQFVQNGKLANTEDTNFRAIDDNWPVFAFAHDLGTVSSATAPVVYSVGHIRDPAIQYIIAGGALQDRSTYFWSTYSTTAAAVGISIISDVRSCSRYPTTRYLSSLAIMRMRFRGLRLWTLMFRATPPLSLLIMRLWWPCPFVKHWELARSRSRRTATAASTPMTSSCS